VCLKHQVTHVQLHHLSQRNQSVTVLASQQPMHIAMQLISRWYGCHEIFQAV
jgi:hypothetical protein